MYPQPNPRRSPITPQFNPIIQLSPRRVVTTDEVPVVVDPLPVTFSPRTTVSPPRTTTSPPRVVEYGNFEPRITIAPPRLIEPPVIVSPRRGLRMPERVTTLPPPVRDIVRFNQQETISLDDLPRDVLIELLINLPPGRLSALCGTNIALSKLCNDEQFLKNLITRKYGVSIDLIPGQTIKEKYAFISQFDPRYFTDPYFVMISPQYKQYYGLNYAYGGTPNVALNNIISIQNDAYMADDIYILKNFDPVQTPGGTFQPPGQFSLRLVNLLSGAIMTQSQPFANAIISILMERIPIEDFPYYNISFRYPYILSILYNMDKTKELLEHYYDRKDPHLLGGMTDEIAIRDSTHVLDRFISYPRLLVDDLYWNLVKKGKLDLAEYVLDKLRNIGIDPYDPELMPSPLDTLRWYIYHGKIDRIKYLLKYVTPTQREIDFAIEREEQKGFHNLARIVQGLPEVVEEIEDDAEVVDA